MAAADYSVDAVKVAIEATIPGVRAPAAERLATVVRQLIAADLGERDVDAMWDPDIPPDAIVEACIRTAAYLHQSRGKLGSKLITESSISGNPVKSSGARGLLMPWRTPRLVVEA